jgi:hypothetical protein
MNKLLLYNIIKDSTKVEGENSLIENLSSMTQYENAVLLKDNIQRYFKETNSSILQILFTPLDEFKVMSPHVYGIMQEELESTGFEILMIPRY